MRTSITCGLAIVALLAAPLLAGTLKWEKKLDSDVVFKVAHDSGVIVVGTKSTVYGFDPQSGRELWKIEKLMKNYDPGSVQPQAGSPYMVYSYKAGLMKPPEVRCLDITTGELKWTWVTTSPQPQLRDWIGQVRGKALKADEQAAVSPAGFPVPVTHVIIDDERGQFLLGAPMITFTIGKMYGKRFAGKTKEQSGGLIAVDMATGAVKWVALLPKEKTKVSYPWSRPQIVGDQVLVDWAGLHVFDLTDGHLVSATPFERKALKGQNGPTVIGGDQAYVAAGGRLVAVNWKTGGITWESKRNKKAAYAEILLAGDKLALRLGGSFEAKKGETKTFDPGFDVWSAATGKPLIDTRKLHKPKNRRIGAITPLQLEDGLVYFATSRSLRAFDLAALDYKYVVDLGDIDEQDAPKSVLFQDGHLCVTMLQSTKAFDPAGGSLLWSKTLPPPKVSKWAKLALAAANGMAAANAQATANRTGRTQHYSRGSLANVRYQAAVASGLYNYVLTTEDKHPTVVGISLKSGNADRRATMTTKSPNYVIDEIGGLLINVKDKKTLQVFDLKQ